MARHSIEKYDALAGKMRCPVCHTLLTRHDASLTCESGHTFTIAAKGYSNLIPNQKPLHGYNRSFFENRKVMMHAGLYDHVVATTVQALEESFGPSAEKHQSLTLLDAGCGEGFYSRTLNEQYGYQVIGLDVAKDGIAVAATGGGDVLWLVGDVANIPLADHSVDAVLDVFTPANYTEFSRVLKPAGKLIKVIPGPQHMIEIRELLGNDLSSQTYSNKRVYDYFEEHLSVDSHLHACKTIDLTTKDDSFIEGLLQMTPVMFNQDKDVFDTSRLTSITVDAEILVGSIS